MFPHLYELKDVARHVTELLQKHVKAVLKKACFKEHNRGPNAEEMAEIERCAKQITSRSLRKGGMTHCRVNQQLTTQHEYARSGHASDMNGSNQACKIGEQKFP